MKLPFFVFNSFTDEAFHGNPAAVVPDADNLDDATMQAVARQLNLVETVFVLKSTTPEADCRFRYFTPHKELPIAGHPTIAGWKCLTHTGAADISKKTSYVQQTGAGDIRIELSGEKIFTSQKDATLKKLDDFITPENMAVFNLTPDDLLPSLPAAAVDAGLGHIIFGVRSLDTLMKMRMVPEVLGEMCERYGVREVQIFCPETYSKEVTGHTRNLCPRYGLEDPACGNGNAALGAYFMKFLSPGKDSLHLSFEQGHIVNMPAVIEVVADKGGIMIGGNARLMVEGQLEL